MAYRRHSVWIDVFGVVALLALLLAPLAYLATEMTGGSGGGGGGALVGRSGGSSPGARQSVRAQHQRSARPRSSLFGVSNGSEESARVPFSEPWRAQATPTLTAPESEARGGRVLAGGSGGSEAGAGASASESSPTHRFSSSGEARGNLSAGRSGGLVDGGPALAGRMPSDGGGSAARGRPAGRDWQEEARSAARTGRKLVGEIEQMSRASTSGGTTAKQSPSDPGSPDDPDRRNPGSPSNVPIGDHLHWLAVAGILWGTWRIGRGG